MYNYGDIADFNWEMPFYVIKFSHAFMPSECGMLLYNALISIETIKAFW